MKYFDLYASYPDYTIAAAWDSQVKEAERTPWLATTLTHCGDELLARFAVRYASCALCLAVRGATSKDELRVRASWPRFYRNTYSMADDGSSIGWHGRWPAPRCCWR